MAPTPKGFRSSSENTSSRGRPNESSSTFFV
ncbi:hypothetical protein RO3G_00756 [Rhizopus delemar RA 99-880]|uniref:Uncharacterized protein n=1 Tax=Rhizopus delemar (strain RA 99-880 / ATCC MYA-4621 / FGSC 9543 / NRRL 43880) TaxID=246409 RepID=I1BIM2_RHIO9|nr:hypothetical protein RO3G_00756 [Rhizopus delemar RA 99-880]|eukprot:EIE76052.1 hypothetical protein RO3G_00756 [Rhizopus delemar RA 99-880]